MAAVRLGVVVLFALAPAAAGAADRPVTFTKDVAPILQEKCQACHRPNSIAPMPLQTFDEVRPWARSIKTRVAARQMPPWHIDKTVGIQQFKNDASLGDDQIDTIVRWSTPARRRAIRKTCLRRAPGPTTARGDSPRSSARRIS